MRGEVFPDGTTIIVPEYLSGCYPAVHWDDEGGHDPMRCGIHDVEWADDGCPVES